MRKIFLLLSSMCLISSANADSAKHWKLDEYELNPSSEITLIVPDGMHGKELFLSCTATASARVQSGAVVFKVDGKVNVIRTPTHPVEIIFPHRHKDLEDSQLKIKIQNLDDSYTIKFKKCHSRYFERTF